MTKTEFQRAELTVVCEGLLFRVFQQRPDQNGCGRVVALTSPHSGAGVSQITNALAQALCRDGDQSAISLCCRHLNKGESWHRVHASLSSALDRIRRKYTYALIDCGSMKETHDAVRLASLVDGIVLVVEANRTQREQILHAEKTLESLNGRILGHILNKRTYVIPNWCHRMLGAVGL